MTRFSSRHRLVLVAILLLAAALRLYRLGADSLWYDETVSALLASKPLTAMWAHTARDIHPPLYYALLHIWVALAGRSEFALAFLSLGFGIVNIALIAHLGLRAYEPRLGLLAALLAAISPLAIWYSQEVRMYTVGACWLLLLLILTWRFLQQPQRSTLPLLATYALLAALSLWTLYYSAFALLALNGFVLPWLWLRNRRKLIPWLLAQAAALLLYLPWLPIALRQSLHPPVPPWRETLPPLDLLIKAGQETSTALVAGQSVDPATWWPLGMLALCVALAAFTLPSRLAARRRWPGALFLWITTLGPLLLILLTSLIFTPLYHVRYLALYSSAYPILLAAGLLSLARTQRLPVSLRRLLASLLLFALLFFSILSLRNYVTNRYAYEAADDLRGAVHFLSDHVGPRDAIVIDAGYLYPALLYYWPGDIGWLGRLSDYPPPRVDGAPPVILSGHIDGDPSIGWGDSQSDFYPISRQQTADRLAQLFADFDAVWLLRVYDTVNDPTGFIRAWLSEHGDPFIDQVFRGNAYARVQAWRTSTSPRMQPPHIGQPLVADFTGGIRLLGYDLAPAQAGQSLRLALYWQRSGPIARPWKVFNQLLGPTGQIVAQNDAQPGLGAYPTDHWQPDEIVTSAFVLPLPPDLPPGNYQLLTGFYDEHSGERLLLAGSRDAVTLTTIAIP